MTGLRTGCEATCFSFPGNRYLWGCFYACVHLCVHLCTMYVTGNEIEGERGMMRKLINESAPWLHSRRKHKHKHKFDVTCNDIGSLPQGG